MLVISLLGPVDVQRDGSPVDVPGDVARRLLVALATERPASVERLIDVAWGESLPRSPKAALQSQISRLRARVGDDVLVTTGGGYQLANTTVDVDRFEQLSRTDDPENLRQAIDLVRGQPLSDVSDAPALEGTRRALIELIRSSILRLCDMWIEFGKAEDAIPRLERLAGEEPLFEPAWRSLALAYYAAGRQAAAIQTVDRYRTAMAEAGLEPSPAMLAVEERVFEDPAATVQIERRVGIRAARPQPVGRGMEVERLTDLVLGRRMVSVVGPGGMGKTTLAEVVALSVLDRFPGGAVEIELVADLGESDVASTVARSFGLRSSDDPVEAVAAAIGTRETLVLIDNCEHVAASVSTVAQRLCELTPHVTVLCTSRERLGSPLEHVLEVGPLDIDACVELFTERAQAAGAALVDADRPLIAALCARLDCMPLAIEMAAARTRSLTPAELLEVIDADGSVLEAHTSSPRHRSIDALVEWSYRLLSTEERELFRAISVFAGPFEAEDAADVLERPLVQTLVTLGRLVDRSLLSAHRRDAVTEFQMLTTLRSVAQKKLALSGGRTRFEAAHARWVSSLTMSMADLPDRPDQRHRLERLSAAIPDVLAAHRRAVGSGDVELQSRLIGPLFSYAYLVLPPGLAEAAESTLDQMGKPRSDMQAWLCAVVAAYRIAAGHAEEAEAVLSMATAEPPGSETICLWLMTCDVAVYRGDLDKATDAAARTRALMTNRSTVSPGGWTDGRLLGAVALAYGGRVDEAVDLADEALTDALDHGGAAYIAMAEYTSGEVRQDTDPTTALVHLDRAIAMATRYGITFVEGIARVTHASVLSRTSREVEALGAFSNLIDMLERTGARIHLWTALRNLVVLLGHMGHHEHAALLLGATEDRVSPTFGDEQRRLIETAGTARSALSDFDAVRERGRGMPIHDVPSIARSIIDAVRTET